jgi:HNH endonuclease
MANTTILASNMTPITISKQDLELVSPFRWDIRKSKTGAYALTVIGEGDQKRRVLMHRFILNAPETMVVDHVDGDGLNNSRENLRLCTMAENAANRTKPKGAMAYHGVSGNSGWYLAAISINGVQHTLGRFPTAELAAEAFDSAARRYRNGFTALNFPDRDIPAKTVEQIRASLKTEIPRLSSSKGGSTAFTGVVYRSRSNGFYACITIGSRETAKQHGLGTYENAADAAIAYDSASRYFGSRGELSVAFKLNFPDRDTLAKSPDELRRESKLARRRNYTSAHIGVARSYGVKWQAGISLDHKHKHIGVFETEEEAALAYDAVAKWRDGYEATLNFPDRDTPPMSIEEARGKFHKFKRGRRGPIETIVEDRMRRYFAGEDIGPTSGTTYGEAMKDMVN